MRGSFASCQEQIYQNHRGRGREIRRQITHIEQGTVYALHTSRADHVLIVVWATNMEDCAGIGGVALVEGGLRILRLAEDDKVHERPSEENADDSSDGSAYDSTDIAVLMVGDAPCGCGRGRRVRGRS